MKTLTTDGGMIVEAITKSSEVEVIPGTTGVKRKGNKPLPELEPKITKKLKTDENSKENGSEETKEPDYKDIYTVKTPVIFVVKSEKNFLKGRRSVQEKLEEVLKMRIPYVRYAKVEGNFVVDKSALTEEQQAELIANGITVDGLKFEITLGAGEELEQFWEKHGNHYKSCVDENKKRDNKKENKRDRKKGQKNDKKSKQYDLHTKEIVFGNQKYSDVNKLKGIFKNILQQTSNDEVIKEPHHTMLLELLKFHEHHDNKIKDLQNFTVEPHPEHKESRCFFVVRKDGTKEDFSANKCLEKLSEKFE